MKKVPPYNPAAQYVDQDFVEKINAFEGLHLTERMATLMRESREQELTPAQMREKVRELMSANQPRS